MYNKSKNKVLFALFILIILMIVFVLVLSVYSSKQSKNIEEYKISLNNVVYDKEYNYISLKKDAVLKKEWDEKYYLYENKKSRKYELGIVPVFYDKSKNEVSIFGNIYQVFPSGETAEKTEKTVVNNLEDFSFFKLSDRQYLVIGNTIKNESFSTKNYLLVSIDRAGNATLLNNNVNIKTINPLVLWIGDIKFDIANEKLIIGEDKIDLKKINGSTNEYVEKEEEKKEEQTVIPPSSEGGNNTNNNGNNDGNNNANNNASTSNSQIYNEIINQIINISGLVSNTTNKTNLYKNISLRGIGVGASYLDVNYSVIDPEDKYLSVFLSLEDEQNNVNYYYLSKEASHYRISGLKPNKQYKISINYIEKGNSSSIVADTVMALTSTDPTSVRITKINGTKLTYKIKMYSEYEFASASVALTDCESDGYLGLDYLNIKNSLSNNGHVGEFVLDSNYTGNYVCLKLVSVKDYNGNDITINSYHKIKIN